MYAFIDVWKPLLYTKIIPKNLVVPYHQNVTANFLGIIQILNRIGNTNILVAISTYFR